MIKYKILNEFEKVDKEFIDKNKGIEIIGTATTGLDHIDLKLCEKKNIKIVSLQDEREFLENITSTAEHTIGLIIALFRNYKTIFKNPCKKREATTGHSLNNKTIGIIGYGRIGHMVDDFLNKDRGSLFGMNILYYEKKQKKEDLINLLQKSDVVSIHIPLENNQGFFTIDMFRIMKPSAYFVNTSRSKIVEDRALLYALNNNLIAGAGVDFIDDKELVAYSMLNDNLILSNHQGGNTFEDKKKTKEFIKQKIKNICLK